jgi:hypothetical protein
VGDDVVVVQELLPDEVVTHVTRHLLDQAWPSTPCRNGRSPTAVTYRCASCT